MISLFHNMTSLWLLIKFLWWLLLLYEEEGFQRCQPLKSLLEEDANLQTMKKDNSEGVCERCLLLLEHQKLLSMAKVLTTSLLSISLRIYLVGKRIIDLHTTIANVAFINVNQGLYAIMWSLHKYGILHVSLCIEILLIMGLRLHRKFGI